MSATLPWGPIKKFEVKIKDRELDDESPIQTEILISMWPEAEKLVIMLGLCLPDIHSREQAAEYHQHAREIEALLDRYIKTVSVQTLS